MCEVNHYHSIVLTLKMPVGVRETEKLIKKLLVPRKEPKSKKDPMFDPIIQSLQKNIEDILGKA